MLTHTAADDDDDYDGRYKCYACGARICNMYNIPFIDEYEGCCEEPMLVPMKRVKRTEKRWAMLSMLVKYSLPVVRCEMLKRCIEKKYAPGGSGACAAASSFELAAKRQREDEEGNGGSNKRSKDGTGEA